MMLNPCVAWMDRSASSQRVRLSAALDASLGFAPQMPTVPTGVFAFGLGRDAAAALAAAAASATFRLFSASAKPLLRQLLRQRLLFLLSWPRTP